MIYSDAFQIATNWVENIKVHCEPGFCEIVGSVRRKKREVHDIELIAKPLQKHPTPVFGDKEVFDTHLDLYLSQQERSGLIKKVKAGPKAKQYILNLAPYDLTSLNEFKLEFYLITPPAQWGVGMVIRTGPGSPQDHFSKWCVTNRSQGGGLPDGYKVKHLAVWNADQLDAKNEPLKGEVPISMPTELDFLNFLGMGYIDPQFRHAPGSFRKDGLT